MNCLNCNKETSNPRFCNSRCAAIFNNKKRRRTSEICLQCGNKCKHWGTRFCSVACHKLWRYKEYIRCWLRGLILGGTKTGVSEYVRRYLIETRGQQCEKCSWSEVNPVSNRVPIEINHKNGNPYDHREQNLELLCPNHHSLTPNFRALNKGNGRVERRRRREQGSNP